MLGSTLAYNLLDLTTAVQDDLKDQSFSSTRIRRYLNHGQKVIFNTHFFDFCAKSYTGALTLASNTLAQQADHQITIDITLVDPTNTNQRVVLNRENYMLPDEYFATYPYASTYTSRMPSVWTEFGGLIYFDVPADQAYIFIQRYYRIPTDMEGSDSVPDVPSVFRELLELWADYRAEKYRGNHDVAATYKQEFEDELEQMAIRYSTGTMDGPVSYMSSRVRLP